MDPSSPKSWGTLEQFSACALTCVPGYEKLTQVCCDTGLDAVCANLPWDTLKIQLGTCNDSASTGVSKSAWISLEQFAACFITCVTGYEKLAEACCQTGTDAICKNLPWSILKTRLGTCQAATTTTTIMPVSTTPQGSCQDEPQAVGCLDPDILREVCRDRQTALTICPRSCGLCDQLSVHTTPMIATTTRTDSCQDDVASRACIDPTILKALCHDNKFAWRFCPRSCNMCDTCWDYLNCTSPEAQKLFCGREGYAIQYCRKTCGKCAHKPSPVTVNQCGDPVANEMICELLHTEICICNDPSVKDLCQNFCNDKCTTKVSSLPTCSPISTTATRMRRDELLQRILMN
ncbi:uncharacterized protein LOC123542466 isoform X2 [Mercenaria mercenaria]|uniref:uncharacterized protein LOC123542466 isoform X2 n=1 Tax=Mercenaria mercenaria TaxID=6596 RepID=UPI00234F71EE|nr:uncharacterized protein LOC123542466 isoform X2 [Mercenaria mercenaria]